MYAGGRGVRWLRNLRQRASGEPFLTSVPENASLNRTTFLSTKKQSEYFHVSFALDHFDRMSLSVKT